MRQAKTHTTLNRTQRSQLRSAIKKVRAAAAADAKGAYDEAVQADRSRRPQAADPSQRRRPPEEPAREAGQGGRQEVVGAQAGHDRRAPASRGPSSAGTLTQNPLERASVIPQTPTPCAEQPQMPASSAPQRSQYHSVGRLSVPHSPHLSVFATPGAPGLPGAVGRGPRSPGPRPRELSRPTRVAAPARRQRCRRLPLLLRRDRLEERQLVAGRRRRRASPRARAPRAPRVAVTAPWRRAAAAARRRARVQAPARGPPPPAAGGGGGRRRCELRGAADQALHLRQARDLAAHGAQLPAQPAELVDWL